MSATKTAVKWPSSEASWKTLSRFALTLLLCVLAVSCKGFGTRRTAVEPLPRLPEALLELLNPQPRFDPAGLQPCPPNLPEARSDDVPTLIRNHVEVAGIYHDCRLKHEGLGNAARERERLDAERIERARKAMGWAQ